MFYGLVENLVKHFCCLSREYNGPVIVVSPDGGVDIEEVAEKTPERILKMPIDIHTGRSSLPEP
jgi:succinyl-CoA synthetase beta subunit